MIAVMSVAVLTGAELALAQSDSTLTVVSSSDSGEGSLRWALQAATHGDTIVFHAMVFPPAMPVTIALGSELPGVIQGQLILNASSAGVILDGSGLGAGSVGLFIESDSNTVRGLQILNFPAAGIEIADSADHNTIEGNVISLNGGSGGLEIFGPDNVVRNNKIGVDPSGTVPWGNSASGICVNGGSNNQIGPGNLIANNGAAGVEVGGVQATGNTISQNSITGNVLEGIQLSGGGNGELPAPVITVCREDTVSGTAPASCPVEVFSDAGTEGEIYEGTTVSDGSGGFLFHKPDGWTGAFITATATDGSGNTSEFSGPASVATDPATWSGIKSRFRR
jgi:hypothetical protein